MAARLNWGQVGSSTGTRWRPLFGLQAFCQIGETILDLEQILTSFQLGLLNDVP